MTITRTAWTDDDGSGGTGTVLNNAVKTELYNQIDAALAADIAAGVAAGAGAWITPTFAAGTFSGNGALTWVVDAGDVTTFAYTIAGKTMTVAFSIDTSTLGGTVNFKIFILIPASKTAAKTVVVPMWMNFSGTPEIGYVQVDAGGTSLSIFRTAQGNFSLNTNLVAMRGVITFPIT